MKRFNSFLAVVLVGLLLVNVNDALAKGKGKQPVMWPAADIKWEEMKGGPPGIQYSNLWGDVMKSAYGALVKLPANLNHPLHTHSADTKCVVISGTFWVAMEGGEKKMFGPGSYFMIPGGVKHTSGTDGETMVFQEGSGKFDMNPVEMKKEKRIE